jgi:hypothetical protein
MSKVWKIKTNLTEQENKQLLSKMSEDDHELMTTLELKLSVDVIENETITSFVICNELNLEKLKSLLLTHNVEFSVEDTTEFFITEEVSVDELSDDYIYEKLGI